MAASAEWIKELHARGVSDGLPVVPPTPEAVRTAVATRRGDQWPPGR